VLVSSPSIYRVAELTSFTLGYKPQLVVSNAVGITRPPSATSQSLKGKASGTALIRARSPTVPPVHGHTSSPWSSCFKIHDQYDKSAPFDGNVGMAAPTLVQALQARQRTSPAKRPTRSTNKAPNGPAPDSSPTATQTDHGYSGTQISHIKSSKIVLTGTPHHHPRPSSPITPTPPPNQPHRNRRPSN
jgi:hypothetical protein